MTSTLTELDPAAVQARLKAGALLVDIREPGEFAAGHIAGALLRPLSSFEAAHLRIEAGRDVIFSCGSGMRTGANCDRLCAAVDGEAFVLKGGMMAWAKAGLPVETRSAPRSDVQPVGIMRQVLLTAGLIVLTGALLGWLVHPLFFALCGLVGAGLTYAGASGNCMMAKLLALAPWNRTAAA